MNRRLIAIAAMVAAVLAAAAVRAAPMALDLTHPTPTCQPMADDPTRADMSRPWGDARQIPTFGAPAILSLGKFPTDQGHLPLGTLTVSEHHGTHVDAAGHCVNNKGSLEAANIAPEKRRLVHGIPAEDGLC